MNYTLDSFIQYTVHLSVVRLRENKRHGHYIAFRKIGGEWLHFDDAVVHRVQLQRTYNVNLVIYRWQDRDPYISPLDFMEVPALRKSVILNRKVTTSQSVPASDNAAGVSGRPSLLTYDAGTSTWDQIETPVMKPELPMHYQPQRASKDYIVYHGIDSQSSDEEDVMDRTHPDSEYIPDILKGNLML